MKEAAIAFVLFVVVLPLFFIGLDQEPYHSDESLHTSRGIRAISLIAKGEIGGDAWGNYYTNEGQVVYGKIITPANVIMGIGPWLIGVRSGGWAFNIRPPDHVLVSARAMVSILGAITCVILFYLGRALGSFRTGLFAYLLLAFNPLWLTSSRRAMRDTPSTFFATISVFFFYHSMKRKDFKGKAIFTALSGVTTGLAVASKLPTGVIFVMIAIYLLLTFVNEYYIDRTISLSQRSRETLLCLFIFTTLSLLAFVASLPAGWSNPELFISAFKFGEKTLTLVGNSPAVPGDRLAAAVGIVNFVLWPIYVPNPLRHFPTCLTWLNLSNYPFSSYSTLAATSFFFIGLAYLGLRGIKKKLSQIETLALMWLIIAFVGLSWWVPILWARYFIPLIPPIVLIEAVGLSYILRGISWKMGYLFAGASLATHVGSVLTGFPEYYLFTLQSLFVNSIGLTLTVTFIVSMFWITISRVYLRLKHQNSRR